MNIRGISKLASSGTTSKLGRRLFDALPNITVNKEELLCNIGRVISRPDVGRGIMGATAILTQPFIDYYNPKVDRETAKVSTSRTIGKIIAGTTVGCCVRSLCYYGTRALTCLKPDAHWVRKILLPPATVVSYLNRRFGADWIKNYNSALATLIGLGVMLFTNVLLDVPFTNYISKKVRPLFGLKPQDETQQVNKPSDAEVKPSKSQDVSEKILERFSNRNVWRVD